MAVESREAGAECADPRNTGTIVEDRPGVVARQALARRVRRRAAVEKLIESVTGAHPERSLVIFEDGVHRALRQPILRLETLSLLLANAAEAVVCPDEHRAVA